MKIVVCGLLSEEIADHLVEAIKSRDVVTKTNVGGSTLAMCTHFPQNYFMASLLADVAMLQVILLLVYVDLCVFEQVVMGKHSSI